MLSLVLRQSSTDGLQVPQKQRTKSCNAGRSNSFCWKVNIHEVDAELGLALKIGGEYETYYDPVISKPKII